MEIPFNKPYLVGKELEYIHQAHRNGHLSSNGPFTQRCQSFLGGKLGCGRAYLTHSCTAALEMAALLVGVGPGDEIIMPSFTFVSTANAFVIRGGIPVFVDIRPDTLNLDETQVEAAITPKTKAIVAVHYAGVPCEMDALSAVARKHGIRLIEDAAQGFGSSYKGKPLGGVGALGALSFHETKNVISGEGGALLVNEERLFDRADVLWEKGTNRKKFFLGEVDKYTWVDVGSSFAPNELTAAFLLAQLEASDGILKARGEIWRRYHEGFREAEAKGWLRRPLVPEGCSQNFHMYHLLLPTAALRDGLLAHLHGKGIQAVFHFIPLHDSPAGTRYGRAHGPMAHTLSVSSRLARLPFWIGMEGQDRVIQEVLAFLGRQHP